MRNGYRVGRKQLVTLLSLALHAQVRRLAAVDGVSMADWVAEAVRERVSRCAGSAGGAVDVPVASDGGGSGFVRGGGGEGVVGVGGVVGGQSGLTGADRLAALIESKSPPAAAAELPTVGDTNNTSDPIDMIA